MGAVPPADAWAFNTSEKPVILVEPVTERLLEMAAPFLITNSFGIFCYKYLGLVD
jgi:hypothetical protein